MNTTWLKRSNWQVYPAFLLYLGNRTVDCNLLELSHSYILGFGLCWVLNRDHGRSNNDDVLWYGSGTFATDKIGSHIGRTF